MAIPFVIADIVSDIARRCNVPPFTATTNTTSGQVTYWLAQSARSLSAILQSAHCEDADLVTTATLNTVAGFDLVSLPQGSADVHAVVWQKRPDDFRLLEPASLDELESIADPEGPWETAPRYRLEGNLIRLLPASTEAETLTLFYTSPLATVGETTIQSRLDTDMWITLDVAIKVLLSKGRDVTALQAEKTVLEANIKAAGRRRDAYAPSTIRDVRGRATRRSLRDRWGY